jgi:hypothetical protein
VSLPTLVQYSDTRTIQRHSYNTATLVQCSDTLTIQRHSYNTATLLQYSDTRTMQRHSYNAATLVQCSDTRTMQRHSYNAATLFEPTDAHRSKSDGRRRLLNAALSSGARRSSSGFHHHSSSFHHSSSGFHRSLSAVHHSSSDVQQRGSPRPSVRFPPPVGLLECRTGGKHRGPVHTSQARPPWPICTLPTCRASRVSDCRACWAGGTDPCALACSRASDTG